MEIEQIRRDRLKAWFKDRTLPPREKSYLSQLITGASSSFGEKAARRLEKTYEMPTGYLDTPLHADPAQARANPVNPVVAEFEWAYNNVNDAGKEFLLSSIHAAKAGFMVKRKSKTA